MKITIDRGVAIKRDGQFMVYPSLFIMNLSIASATAPSLFVLEVTNFAAFFTSSGAFATATLIPEILNIPTSLKLSPIDINSSDEIFLKFINCKRAFSFDASLLKTSKKPYSLLSDA